MATFSVRLLSGSTNGRPIKVAATATPGTILHTVTAADAGFDEVYLWVCNTSNAAVALTIELGGTTAPDDLHPSAYSVPANSTSTLVLNGVRLNGGVVIRAFASSANVLTITGNVNRIGV